MRKKVTNLKLKKQPQNINLFVPSQYLPSVQEEEFITCPEERVNDIQKYIPEAEPFEIPQVWEEKTEEEINEELLPPEFIQREQSKELLLNMNKKISQINKNDRNLVKKKTSKINKKEKEKEKENIKINSNNGTIENEEQEEINYTPYEDPMHQ